MRAARKAPTIIAAGPPVVRCFVKGAAPAVLARASSALCDGGSVAWDDQLARRAQEEIERMGGEGLRVMAAAQVDLTIVDGAVVHAR